MTKLNSAYTLPDLQGETAHFRRFLLENLGFDTICQCEINVKHDKVEVNINAEDKFQRARSYGERIGEVKIWESGPSIVELIDEAWVVLNKAMHRDERELRYGLAQLGDAIEGDGFVSEVGKMMAARIRATRDELSGNLLTFERKSSDE